MSAVLVALAAFPAKGEVEWLATEYNFGSFKEANGNVTGSVKLVNHGPDATFINRVRPSCGCTGASYTHSMIEPGDTATVSFTYNPVGRPGPFDKTVKVYMGPDNDLTVIRIMGTVIGAPTTLKANFPVECGPLRLENTLVPAGEIKRGHSRHLFLNVYNQGEKPITPTWHSDAKALTVEVTPREIAPGDLGTFSFYLRTAEEPADGPYDYPIVISADGEGSDEVTVTVSVAIVPDTRAIPLDQLENSPQAFLLPEFVDLGEEVGNKDVEFEFSILNEGNSPLDVMRVYCRQEGIDISRVPSTVREGKKGLVKGKLHASKIPEGPFRLKVEVLTNDPLHPIRTCNIVGIKAK
ncbi:MAG: DUF1573 domain-containing protein [Muribaculaceae bacterium]|nr:DUF1573 domain-containing protein [Muribaculaceae bacterium]